MKTITVDFETTGVDFCTPDRFLSSYFALCSFANYPDKVAKDELLSVPAQPLSCIIVQYRALSCKIAHYLRNSAKIIGLFFGRYREMLYLCIRFQKEMPWRWLTTVRPERAKAYNPDRLSYWLPHATSLYATLLPFSFRQVRLRSA